MDIKGMRTAAAYIRVSTDLQTEYSPDSQLRMIHDYAKKNDLIVFEEFIYADEGISGRKAEKRPRFQKMLIDAKQKKFEAILIYNTSRFARNHEESVVYRSMLKREGIEVISITQPNIDEKTDLLMNALYAVMDERFSLDLSENVKRGMVEKAMRGETVNSVPYGYKILESKKTPVIVEHEAEIVKRIFNSYVNENKPARAIATNLNELGVGSPRGKLWTRERIDQILSNSFYCGYTRYNLRYSDTKKLKDESEHIIRPGKHLPIISEDTHKLVLARMAKNFKNEKTSNVKAHWLSGVVKCANCGSSLNVIRGTSKAKLPFLRCRGYMFGICSETQYTSASLLETYLIKSLSAVLLDPENAAFERIPPMDEDGQRQLILKAIQRTEKKLERIKSAYENGIDTLEEYKDGKAKIFLELETLKHQIKEIDEKNYSAVSEQSENKLIKSVNGLIEIICSAVGTETKINAVKSIISKIVYSKKDKTFKVYYFMP